MIIYGGGASGRIHRNVQPLEKAEKQPTTRTRRKDTVIVTDLKTGMIQEFLTMGAAAKYLKCSHDAVCKRCNNKIEKPYKDRYQITRRRES